jgi:hypothetical protein
MLTFTNKVTGVRLKVLSIIPYYVCKTALAGGITSEEMIFFRETFHFTE